MNYGADHQDILDLLLYNEISMKFQNTLMVHSLSFAASEANLLKLFTLPIYTVTTLTAVSAVVANSNVSIRPFPLDSFCRSSLMTRNWAGSINMV